MNMNMVPETKTLTFLLALLCAGIGFLAYVAFKKYRELQKELMMEKNNNMELVTQYVMLKHQEEERLHKLEMQENVGEVYVQEPVQEPVRELVSKKLETIVEEETLTEENMEQMFMKIDDEELRQEEESVKKLLEEYNEEEKQTTKKRRKKKAKKELKTEEMSIFEEKLPELNEESLFESPDELYKEAVKESEESGSLSFV